MCACLAGPFAAYGRGVLKTFECVEIFLGEQEFTLLFEYLKRYNLFKSPACQAYVLIGLSDTLGLGKCSQTKEFRWYGNTNRAQKGAGRLLNSLYKLEPWSGRGKDPRCPPIRIEINVVSSFLHSRLPVGHSSQDCMTHSNPSRIE